MASPKLGKRKDGILRYAPNILFLTRPVFKNIYFTRVEYKDDEQKRQNTISMKPRTTFFNMRIKIQTMGIPGKKKDGRNRRDK